MADSNSSNPNREESSEDTLAEDNAANPIKLTPAIESRPTEPLHEVQNLTKDVLGLEPVETSISISKFDYSKLMRLDQQLNKSKRDLESMVIKYARSESENLQLKSRVDELDKKLRKAMKDNEQLANSYLNKITADNQQNTVQSQRIRELEEKVVNLEKTNAELQNQVDINKSKEGELLDFSERLSMKHMMLQAELDEALRQVALSNGESAGQAPSAQVDELTERVRTLEELVQRERLVIENLKADKIKLETKHQKDVDELNNELKMTRRKHQLSIKELMKELRQLNCKEATTG